jgi:hypothetical protein
MRKPSLERAGTAALALIAFLAVALALYIQLIERRSRQDADRTSAARLEEELAASRARVEALEKLRAEPTQEVSPGQPGDQLLPNTVLRRGESGGGALHQVLDPRDAQQAALVRLQESLDALERRTAQSDRALRRDLEELRAGVRREQEASGKVQSLLLVALIPLLLHLLTSLRSRRGGRRDEE